MWLNTFVALTLFLPVLALSQSSAPIPAEAIALEQQGNLPEAVKVWQAVIQRNPRDAAALASLGVDYSKLQKYGEAAATYRKALALDSRLPGIQLNLGLA
jgi:Flp pilus assembly protein TadD